MSNIDIVSGNNSGMSVEIGTGERRIKDAEHMVSMIEASEGSVDVIAPAAIDTHEVDPRAERQTTRGQRVLDSLALSAGGRAAFMQIHEYGEAKGGGTVAKFNSAVEEAVNGATSTARHNAHSRAESIINELKAEYISRFGSIR